jgi:peptidyl-tRNA hydrolase ICT1
LYSSLDESSFNRIEPRNIFIPLDKVEFAFARSSGPGGQNVNKLNTKAEVRFKVATADWIPINVRERLLVYQVNKINKEGELVVTSQEHRLDYYKILNFDRK